MQLAICGIARDAISFHAQKNHTKSLIISILHKWKLSWETSGLYTITL